MIIRREARGARFPLMSVTSATSATAPYMYDSQSEKKGCVCVLCTLRVEVGVKLLWLPGRHIGIRGHKSVYTHRRLVFRTSEVLKEPEKIVPKKRSRL